MWKGGTPGMVPVCRYFYPLTSTYFWGKYEDCKLVQMIFPNAENYIGTFYFEEMTLATKPVNAGGTCEANSAVVPWVSVRQWCAKPPIRDHLKRYKHYKRIRTRRHRLLRNGKLNDTPSLE